MSPGKRGRPKSASPKTLTAFRFSDDLLARIDAYANRLREQTRWANVTRADAVRALLVQALDDLEEKDKTRKRS